MASLLKAKSSQEQSVATIQTALGPVDNARLSINDYMAEQASLVEQTKVKVAAKRKKKVNRPHHEVFGKNPSQNPLAKA